jgi:hypothetical protein
LPTCSKPTAYRKEEKHASQDSLPYIRAPALKKAYCNALVRSPDVLQF